MALTRFIEPKRSDWKDLILRPSPEGADLADRVSEILSTVAENGDEALRNFTRRFDGVEIDQFQVTEDEIRYAVSHTPPELKSAIQVAKRNIAQFHESQLQDEGIVETMPGVNCWRRSVPIQTVGLYVPGGTAPLFSTVLMLSIPAGIAGCGKTVLCSPPGKDGKLHQAIIYSAIECGVNNIYKIGGAQAIAAMAFGTESIPKVDKIFGPGNPFVTEAKQQSLRHGVAIDMPAGPSEVLVYADHSAHPAYIAADLLSQAEHGTDSQVILVTTEAALIDKVESVLSDQLGDLPRRDVAIQALKNSKSLLFKTVNDCLDFINCYAPEHLILASDEARNLAPKILNAGSVFLGHLTPESVGDYASGTNHTLPTNGWARSYSGVSVDSFIRKITFQELTKEGLGRIGPTVEIMAQAESLEAHRRAISIRLENLKQS